MKAAFAWLRRQFAFSNSRSAWKERAALFGLIAAGGVGWWFSRDMPLDGRLVLLGLWLVFACLLMRAEIIHFLGPVFFFEILRGSRQRAHWKRVLYAVLLFASIAYIDYIQKDHAYDMLRRQSEMARMFFLTFFLIQMLLVMVLTPVVVAGCIAEEKERRTLEFVLATDLRSSEIVFGKLAARVAGMLLLMLAGLPILSFLQFFGGILPEEVLTAMIVSVVTLVSISVLSILWSVLSRRSRDAIFATFAILFIYLIVSGLAQAARKTDFGRARVDIGSSTIYVSDLIEAFGAGNPIVRVVELIALQEQGAPYGEVLRSMVRDYIIFHAICSALLLSLALLRLRPSALRQSPGGRSRRKRRHRLPAIGQRPMLWKEVYAEPGLRLHFVLRVLLVLMILGSFAPAISIIYDYVVNVFPSWKDLSQLPFSDAEWKWEYSGYGSAAYFAYRFQREMNEWVRLSYAVIGTLCLLAVTVRAAGSITGERARQTLDELLTSRLTNREIVSSKLVGSMLGVRRGLWWVAAVFAIGLLTGGLNIVGAAFAIIAWIAYAVFFASLGVWFSTVARSTFRATVYSCLVGAIALGGHWLFTALFCCLPFGERELKYGLGDGYYAASGILIGLTPPVTLGFAAIKSFRDFEQMINGIEIAVLFGAVGPIAMLLAGIMLRTATIARFAKRFNRTNSRRPERRNPNAIPNAEKKGGKSDLN